MSTASSPASSRGIHPLNVLLAEDDSADIEFIRDALTATGLPVLLDVVTDGADAWDYLRRQGTYGDAARPHLIMLDLRLPRLQGWEVLASLKTDPHLRTIPVVILSASDEDEIVYESYRLYANAYVVKSGNPEVFRGSLQAFAAFYLGAARLPPEAPPFSERDVS